MIEEWQGMTITDWSKKAKSKKDLEGLEGLFTQDARQQAVSSSS